MKTITEQLFKMAPVNSFIGEEKRHQNEGLSQASKESQVPA